MFNDSFIRISDPLKSSRKYWDLWKEKNVIRPTECESSTSWVFISSSDLLCASITKEKNRAKMHSKQRHRSVSDGGGEGSRHFPRICRSWLWPRGAIVWDAAVVMVGGPEVLRRGRALPRLPPGAAAGSRAGGWLAARSCVAHWGVAVVSLWSELKRKSYVWWICGIRTHLMKFEVLITFTLSYRKTSSLRRLLVPLLLMPSER